MSKFNKESNSYIWIFSIVMTVVLGSCLNYVSQKLKPIQDAEVALEQKKFILSASMGIANVQNEIDVQGKNWKSWVDSIYAEKVSSYVVNFNGERIDSIAVSSISTAKEYKKAAEDRLLPVYEVKSGDKIEAYVFPVAGFGLWDRIWGFIALQGDLNTIQGAVFDHKGETPGLGARITDTPVQERFVGKSIYSSDGTLVGVAMQKGEGNAADLKEEPHKVDGLSGATLTAVGLNTMIVEYFGLYNKFIQDLNDKNP